MVVRNLSQENPVRLLGDGRTEGIGRHKKEAKTMGRDYKEEEKLRKLGRDKKEVKRMGRER